MSSRSVRLCEDPGTRVLLLEAGPDVAAPGAEHPDVVDPFCLCASCNPELQWPNLTVDVHQRDAGQARPAVPYLQGYGVGGASNINGMGADRGQPADYEEWCALGALGWGWKDVLPYFKKLESDIDYPERDACSMHGSRGPMPVRRVPRRSWAPFAAAIAGAIERKGFPFIDDYTTDFREGISAAPTNGLADRRVSAAMAYLTREVRARRNLTILPNARVDRIQLAWNRATGVYVGSHAERQRCFAGKEIILSCGALQSPAVLLRSGLGPAAQLRRHGIEPIVDLPGMLWGRVSEPSLCPS